MTKTPKLLSKTPNSRKSRNRFSGWKVTRKRDSVQLTFYGKKLNVQQQQQQNAVLQNYSQRSRPLVLLPDKGWVLFLRFENKEIIIFFPADYNSLERRVICSIERFGRKLTIFRPIVLHEICSNWFTSLRHFAEKFRELYGKLKTLLDAFWHSYIPQIGSMQSFV